MRTYPLPSPMTAYRMADARFAIMSGYGASMSGGRWNSVGSDAVYACLTYEGCVLEKLVHLGSKRIPPSQSYVVLGFSKGIRISEFQSGDVPDWINNRPATARYGDSWLASGSSVALIVPGAVGYPYQRNVIINPNHAQFGRLSVSAAVTVNWDPRLF